MTRGLALCVMATVAAVAGLACDAGAPSPRPIEAADLFTVAPSATELDWFGPAQEVPRTELQDEADGKTLIAGVAAAYVRASELAAPFATAEARLYTNELVASESIARLTRAALVQSVDAPASRAERESSIGPEPAAAARTVTVEWQDEDGRELRSVTVIARLDDVVLVARANGLVDAAPEALAQQIAEAMRANVEALRLTPAAVERPDRSATAIPGAPRRPVEPDVITLDEVVVIEGDLSVRGGSVHAEGCISDGGVPTFTRVLAPSFEELTFDAIDLDWLRIEAALYPTREAARSQVELLWGADFVAFEKVGDLQGRPLHFDMAGITGGGSSSLGPVGDGGVIMDVSTLDGRGFYLARASSGTLVITIAAEASVARLDRGTFARLLQDGLRRAGDATALRAPKGCGVDD